MNCSLCHESENVSRAPNHGTFVQIDNNYYVNSDTGNGYVHCVQCGGPSGARRALEQTALEQTGKVAAAVRYDRDRQEIALERVDDPVRPDRHLAPVGDPQGVEFGRDRTAQWELGQPGDGIVKRVEERVGTVGSVSTALIEAVIVDPLKGALGLCCKLDANLRGRQRAARPRIRSLRPSSGATRPAAMSSRAMASSLSNASSSCVSA